MHLGDTSKIQLDNIKNLRCNQEKSKDENSQTIKASEIYLGIIQEPKDIKQEILSNNGASNHIFADIKLFNNRNSESIRDISAPNPSYLDIGNNKTGYQSNRIEYNTKLPWDSYNDVNSEIHNMQKRISELEEENQILKSENKKIHSLYEDRLIELKWYHKKYGKTSSNPFIV